jgi:hypothetical protein
MRLIGRPRTGTVDALCINQDDMPDRNTQAPLMFRIYRRASKVFVSLGGEEGDSHVAFNFVRSLAFGRHVGGECPGASPGGPCPGKMSSGLTLLRRPWWSCTWTMREATPGRDGPYAMWQYVIMPEDFHSCSRPNTLAFSNLL